MRIAIVHGLPAAGGAYRVLAEIASRLDDHDVTVITRRPPEDEQIVLDPSIGVERLEPLRPVASARDLRVLLRALPQHAAELAGAVDAGGYDAVLCFNTVEFQGPEATPYLRTPSLYFAPEGERQFIEPVPEFDRPSGAAWALYWRGIGPTVRLARAAYRRNLLAATGLVTHSHHTAGQLRNAYAAAADVVHLGVDADRFTPGAGARERYVLSVGSLHPLKGHQFVVAALGSLPERRRPPLVVVAPFGDHGGSLAALARDRGVDLEVRRAVTEAELVDLYRHAGVLALGHHREPFGLIVLEGMATATPVVAVPEGGFLETIEHDYTGLLAQRDEVTFGATVARVLDDPELAARLGTQARHAATTRWTWTRAARGYELLLRRVAEAGAVT